MISLSIPSPGDPYLINSGPIHARWYGLLLALGVLLAGWIARREFRRRGLDQEQVYSIAVWLVPFGLVGARLYHVATDWGAFQHNLSQIPAIWNGGLSIFGAVAGGMLGCWVGCRFAKIPFWQVADCVVPGVILAQVLGRWGNYFNQELYGRPSKWPWALKIDNPPLPYHPGETFQPTFLYESLLDLAVFVVLMWFVRRFWDRVPWATIFALYVVLYDGVRVFIEKLRSDPANIYFGQRVNVWVSGVLFLIGLIAFIILFRRRTERRLPPVPGTPQPVAGHMPTARPTAAIEARLKTQRRKKNP